MYIKAYFTCKFTRIPDATKYQRKQKRGEKETAGNSEREREKEEGARSYKFT